MTATNVTAIQDFFMVWNPPSTRLSHVGVITLQQALFDSLKDCSLTLVWFQSDSLSVYNELA